MKLTEELKQEFDTYTEGKIRALFRFFPSDYTTGETGRYLRDKARRIAESGTTEKGTVPTLLPSWNGRRG